MRKILDRLTPLEIDQSPFVNDVDIGDPIHWLKPVVVAEFKQSTDKTKAGKIRHPVIYLSIREDKDPKNVQAEDAVDVEATENEKSKQKPRTKKSK